MFRQAVAKKPYDAIIVPGIPFDGRQWGRVMKGRVYWSKMLYEEGITKNIIYSGAAVYTPYREADVMASYAIALGIPEKHVFRELRAEHSTENVYYSYKLAKKLGFQKIAVASDPFQTRMLRGFIRKKLGRDVDLIPMVEDSLKAIEPEMKDPLIDTTAAFVKDFIPIQKRQSSLRRFRGTLGKNIDTTAYPIP